MARGDRDCLTEASAAVTLAVWRGNDVDFQAFTVDYATADAIAAAGLDYQAVAGTLSFAAGEIRQTITIPILNDGVREGNRTFRVTPSNPTAGAALGSPAAVTVGINDNDPGPAFAEGEYRVDEGAGAVELTVLRGNDADFPPLSVDFAITPQSAGAGEDFAIPVWEQLSPATLYEVRVRATDGKLASDWVIKEHGFRTLAGEDAPVTGETTEVQFERGLTNGELVLAWPSGAAPEFVLEETDNPAGTNWTKVEVPIQTVGGVNKVSLPLGGTAKFFRLRK